MKNKLRRIIISDITYFYRMICKYQKDADDYKCIIFFRAYLHENKNTSLTIIFETIDDYILGNPLNVGISGINLNLPSWARKLILYGIDKGWNGQEKVDLKCSIELLEKLI